MTKQEEGTRSTEICREPGTATEEEVLRFGVGLCCGYMPNTTPGQYMEIWEYQKYVYMIWVENDWKVRIRPLSTRWQR